MNIPGRFSPVGSIQAHATFLDAHVRRHYPGLFLGVAALLPSRRLVIQATDAEAARRWLVTFGPDFCGWPLDLSLPPESP
jgi:hypothetical protein